MACVPPCVLNLQRNFEQQVRQRLAVPIETEAGVDAAFEDVVQDEIKRRKLRQVIAHNSRWLARGERLGDAFGRNLLCDRRIVRRIAADKGDVQSIALVAGPRIGDFVERDGCASVMEDLRAA